VPGPPARRLRRRLDNLVLRWHARLDSDWSDRSLPWILAGAGFVLLSGLAVARVRMLEAGDDLATYTQAAWLIGRGEPAHLTLADADLLDVHGSLVLYPLGLLARLPVPLAESLLVLQSAALALAVVPLWRLARRTLSLRVGAATCLVVAYLLHPLVQAVNLADFRPEALAVPALMAMSYWGRSGSTARFVGAAVATVACRADLALLVVGAGLVVATGGRRRLGLVTAAVAGSWALASLWVPWLGAGDGASFHPGAFAPYGGTPLEVVVDWLADPLATLGELTARPNFELAVALLLSLAFLPLLALRQLAPALPWLFLVFLADVPEAVRRGPLTAPVVPILLVAAAHGLHKLGRPTLDRVSVHPRTLAALVATTIVFFIGQAPTSPYASPWSWGGRDEVDQARLDAVDLVADDDGVAATPRLAVLVAERRVLRPFRSDPTIPPDVDVVLVDQVDLRQAGLALPVAAPPGFFERSRDQGVVTYRRAP
jgi:uncharacterized membrane protein